MYFDAYTKRPSTCTRQCRPDPLVGAEAIARTVGNGTSLQRPGGTGQAMPFSGRTASREGVCPCGRPYRRKVDAIRVAFLPTCHSVLVQELRVTSLDEAFVNLANDAVMSVHFEVRVAGRLDADKLTGRSRRRWRRIRSREPGCGRRPWGPGP